MKYMTKNLISIYVLFIPHTLKGDHSKDLVSHLIFLGKWTFFLNSSLLPFALSLGLEMRQVDKRRGGLNQQP